MPLLWQVEPVPIRLQPMTTAGSAASVSSVSPERVCDQGVPDDLAAEHDGLNRLAHRGDLIERHRHGIDGLFAQVSRDEIRAGDEAVVSDELNVAVLDNSIRPLGLKGASTRDRQSRTAFPIRRPASS